MSAKKDGKKYFLEIFSKYSQKIFIKYLKILGVDRVFYRQTRRLENYFLFQTCRVGYQNQGV